MTVDYHEDIMEINIKAATTHKKKSLYWTVVVLFNLMAKKSNWNFVF